jgi:hypothetical protein
VEQQLLSHLPPDVQQKLDQARSTPAAVMFYPATLSFSCRDQVEAQLLSHLPTDVQQRLDQA